jgi:hypothetical protein
VGVAFALAASSVTASSFRPALRVGLDGAVRGSHFKAHELIHVVFTSDARQLRRRMRVVHASAVGSFAALVPALTDSCTRLEIRARGSSGDVAALALSRGLCPPPSASGTEGSGTQPAPTETLPDPNGPPTVNPASQTQSTDTQPPQTGTTLPAPNSPPTITSGGGTQGAATQPPQTATAPLPDPHGPATVNPG